MKPFKVVCIKDIDFCKTIPVPADHLVVGEIYTVIRVQHLDYFIGGIAYHLLERDHDNRYGASLFRPVSDCGPAICEWIEETHFKELEYQEAIKQ